MGISLQGTHASPASYVCKSEFSTVFLQEHFYVSAIEIEFRIFRVLAGSKAAQLLLQSI